MADLLATSGADRVLTMDLHSPQIQGFFSIPADQLTGVPALCDRLKNDDLGNTVIVAADVGEAKDAGRFAKRLELPLALGTVGGTLRAHRLALMSLRLIGSSRARDLTRVATSVGLLAAFGLGIGVDVDIQPAVTSTPRTPLSPLP